MSDVNHSAVRRHYACRHCNYMVRYNAPRCGDCYSKTPIYNHAFFWRSLMAAAAVAVILGLGLAFF